MGTVIITTKLMPESPSIDLKAIAEEAKKRLEKEGGKSIFIEEKPIAFGLKAVYVRVELLEEKGSEMVESLLNTIPNVSSATIEDYRRAFG